MAKAYSYIRYSSEGQRDGSSLSRQVKALDKWLRLNPSVQWTGTTYQDLAVSGSSGKHLKKAFGKILLSVEDHVIKSGDYLLVESVDRLGRLPPLEMAGYIHQIVSNGVKIVTLDDYTEYNRDSLNDGEFPKLATKLEQAHAYSKQLKERICESWADRKYQARCNLELPEEERKVIKMRRPFWIDKNNNLIKEYADILKKMFEWHALGDGQVAIQSKICKLRPDLFGEVDGSNPNFKFKVRNNKNNRINCGTVRKWLSNPVSIGYWKNVPDVFPAAIDKQTYFAAQEMFKSRHKPVAKPQSYFVTGLAVCRCGSKVTFTDTAKELGIIKKSSRCNKRGKDKSACDNSKGIPVQVIQFIVNEHLLSGFVSLYDKATETIDNKEVVIIDGEISELESELQKQNEVLKSIKNPTGSVVEIFINEIQDINDRIQKLSDKRLVLVEKQSKDSSLQRFVESDSEDELLLNANNWELNRLLQLIGFKVVLDGKKISFKLKSDDKVSFTYVYMGPNKLQKSYAVVCKEFNLVSNVPYTYPISGLEGMYGNIGFDDFKPNSKHVWEEYSSK